MASIPSFEDIDRAMDAVPASATADTKAAGVGQICAVWPPVKLILQAIIALPLIPEKWKARVRQFIAVVDAICAAGGK